MPCTSPRRPEKGKSKHTLATPKSGLPSWLKSPTTTQLAAPFPASELNACRKVPPPFPSRAVIVEPSKQLKSLHWLVTTQSSLPSPLNSPPTTLFEDKHSLESV